MLRKTILGALVLVVFSVLGTLTFGKAATATAQGTQAAIWTDKTGYKIGERSTLCYTVPQPAYIEITDFLADGTSKVILSGDDDGTGDCLEGTIEPPVGTETLRLSVYLDGEEIATAETNFQVLSDQPTLYLQAAPAPPTPPWLKLQLGPGNQPLPLRCNLSGRRWEDGYWTDYYTHEQLQSKGFYEKYISLKRLPPLQAIDILKALKLLEVDPRGKLAIDAGDALYRWVVYDSDRNNCGIFIFYGMPGPQCDFGNRCPKP